MDLPPEFYGLVSALWSTYQYAIMIWMACFFVGICIIGFVLVISRVLKTFW